jgi:hypothetical protein
MQRNIFFPPLSLKTQHVSALDGHLQVSQYAETATLHQCADYRLQRKQNIGLTNIESKLLQQTQVDDAPCEVKEFYEIKKF